MTANNNAHVLESLVGHDLLRTYATNVTRVQNVDVVQTEDNGDAEHSEIALCHVAMLMPYTRLRETRELEFKDEFENIAAAMLAMEHFNTGNGDIIPEIAGIHKRCNIRFTTELLDTEHSEKAAVERVIDMTSRPPDDREKPLPCAFFGSTRSAVCIPTAIITGIKGYPQFSPECTSPQLNNEDQFPLFGRLINSDDGTALPVIQWLQQRADVNNLAILYRDDAYGIEYARALQHTAKEVAPDMKLALIALPYAGTTDADYDRAIQQVKDTQYRYVFGIISRSLHYDTLMTKAFEEGIAGNPQFTWIFSESLGTKLLARSFEPNSPLHLATKGIGVITPVGGTPGMAIYDKYSQAMQELHNPRDLDYIKSKFPPLEDYNDLSADDYQSHVNDLGVGSPKETFSSLGYDTIMALGQAACAATEASPPGMYFDGPQHFEATVNHQFQGISGTIDLDKTTGSRNPGSALFNIINFVEGDNSNGATEMGFKGVTTDVYEGGAWNNVEPYLFNDGSINAPLDLPALELEYNHIGTPLRAIGLALSGVILLASIGFGLWTYWNRTTRVVRASQPIFLTLICAGTLLMGASIIPLSIDDQIASVQGCTIACMSTWWLVGIGFPIAFSALVTKTNRIVRIMVHAGSFRRVAIGVKDVIVPMVVFMGVNILILSLWTVMSPLVWVRETIDYDHFGRPNESYGHCYSDGSLPYVIALCTINLSCLVVGVAQAYKARHLSTDFAESEYIAMAMVLLLVVGFVAIPVVIISEENPGAFFFVITAVVFVCSMSLLLLIFLPKMRSIQVGGGDVGLSTRGGFRSSVMASSMMSSALGGPAFSRRQWTASNASSDDGGFTMGGPSYKRQWTGSTTASSDGDGFTLGGPPYRRQGTASSTTTSSDAAAEGFAIINRDELLTKLCKENKNLKKATGILKLRIEQILREDDHDEEEEIPVLGEEEDARLKDTTREPPSREGAPGEGMKVYNKQQELKDAQSQNKKLRNLRKQLERKLANLEVAERQTSSTSCFEDEP